jgi:hypothetical protein
MAGCGASDNEDEGWLGTSTVLTIELEGEVGVEVGVVGIDDRIGVDRIGVVKVELLLTAPPPLR